MAKALQNVAMPRKSIEGHDCSRDGREAVVGDSRMEPAVGKTDDRPLGVCDHESEDCNCAPAQDRRIRCACRHYPELINSCTNQASRQGDANAPEDDACIFLRVAAGSSAKADSPLPAVKNTNNSVLDAMRQTKLQLMADMQRQISPPPLSMALASIDHPDMFRHHPDLFQPLSKL